MLELLERCWNHKVSLFTLSMIRKPQINNYLIKVIQKNEAKRLLDYAGAKLGNGQLHCRWEFLRNLPLCFTAWWVPLWCLRLHTFHNPAILSLSTVLEIWPVATTFVRKYAFTSTSVCTRVCLNDAPCKIKIGQMSSFLKLCASEMLLFDWPRFKLPFTEVTKDDNAPILTHQIEDLVKGHKWSRGGGSQPKAMKETTWPKFHQTPSYHRAVTWPPSSDGWHQYFPFFRDRSQRSLVTNN